MYVCIMYSLCVWVPAVYNNWSFSCSLLYFDNILNDIYYSMRMMNQPIIRPIFNMKLNYTMRSVILKRKTTGEYYIELFYYQFTLMFVITNSLCTKPFSWNIFFISILISSKHTASCEFQYMKHVS